jgi:undecaprenyl-diphosphatase
VDALKAVSLVFGPMVFRLVAALLALGLLSRRRFRLALFTFVAVAGGSLLDGIAKTAAGRQRPVLDHPVAHAAGLSFPSGHALGSLVGAGTILLVLLPVMGRRTRRAAIIAAAVIVAAVGFSRVALGVHYVSDVVGGWVLGAAWLLVVTAAFMIWRRETGRPVDVSHGIEPEASSDLSFHPR